MTSTDESPGYEQLAFACLRFGPRLEGLVSELLEAAGLRTYTVTHRIKSRESFDDKLSRDEALRSPADIHDVLGLRVITYFPDEVDVVADVIAREFAIDEANSIDKRAQLDPDRFGYLSLHFVASIDAERAKLLEYSRHGAIKFEIQIRSILQHAWAEIEHDLGYKSAATVPRPIRRRLSRLAGLLEIADAEFQALRADVASYQKAVQHDVARQSLDLAIDRDTVMSYVSASVVVANLDEFLVTRFAERSKSSESNEPWQLVPISEGNASRIARSMEYLGIGTILELDRRLDTEADLIKRFLFEWSGRFRYQRLTEVPRGVSIMYAAYVFVLDAGDAAPLHEYLDVMSVGEDPTRRGELADRAARAYAKAAGLSPGLT